MGETSAAMRLARFARAHGFAISCVEGIFRAWKPDPDDPLSGEMTHGRTAEELLAKLGG